MLYEFIGGGSDIGAALWTGVAAPAVSSLALPGALALLAAMLAGARRATSGAG